MRRGVTAGPVSGMGEYRLEHGACRPLAIGASHRHDRERRGEAQGVAHDIDAVQPHRDVLWMQALDVLEPLGKGSRLRPGRVGGDWHDGNSGSPYQPETAGLSLTPRAA